MFSTRWMVCEHCGEPAEDRRVGCRICGHYVGEPCYHEEREECVHCRENATGPAFRQLTKE